MSEKKKILVIDDETDIVEELVIRLETAGWDVIIACDGQKGLETARTGKPDLILLDVVMPKMNGFQVCRELKGDPQMKTIPVIMLTAKAQESDKFWGKETGADDYLTKPFNMQVLMGKIRGFLEKGQ